MLLKELALIFSKDKENWPIANPSKALPFPIRSFIRNFWGRRIAADDFDKKNAPNRLGVFFRDFENGDPIKTLSRSHILKLNSLVTKMDLSPGRKRVLLLFHNYNNMTYSSKNSLINKGQLAHSICAILEEIHKNFAHTFTIKSLESINFFEQCKQYRKYFNSYEKIYFLSDFLFNEKDIYASSKEVESMIKYFNLKKSVFFTIRDPMEFSNDSLIPENLQLFPWEKKRIISYNGDEAYFMNLKDQLKDLEEKIKSTQNSSKLIIGDYSILEFLNFMNQNLSE